MRQPTKRNRRRPMPSQHHAKAQWPLFWLTIEPPQIIDHCPVRAPWSCSVQRIARFTTLSIRWMKPTVGAPWRVAVFALSRFQALTATCSTPTMPRAPPLACVPGCPMSLPVYSRKRQGAQRKTLDQLEKRSKGRQVGESLLADGGGRRSWRSAASRFYFSSRIQFLYFAAAFAAIRRIL